MVMKNEKHYVVVEQGVASVEDAKTALALEMDPYFDGEVYGAYDSYDEAARYVNQMNC